MAKSYKMCFSNQSLPFSLFGGMNIHISQTKSTNMLEISTFQHLPTPNLLWAFNGPPGASKGRGRSSRNFKISGNFATSASQCYTRLNKNNGWTPAQQLIGRQLSTLPGWNPDFNRLRLFHPVPLFCPWNHFLHVKEGFSCNQKCSSNNNTTPRNKKIAPTQTWTPPRNISKGTHNANWQLYSTPTLQPVAIICLEMSVKNCKKSLFPKLLTTTIQGTQLCLHFFSLRCLAKIYGLPTWRWV